MSSMRERMLRGDDYRADDPELVALRDRASALAERLDATPQADRAARDALLRELLGEVGDGVEIRPGLRVDYGAHIAIGAGTFVNYDCIFLDCAQITLGVACQLGPKVQLLTASHPIDRQRRRDGWECAHPITLGDDVWLGGGVIVAPGVTIGDNTVVGAGAIVVSELPADVVAVGNPASVVRPVA